MKNRRNPQTATLAGLLLIVAVAVIAASFGNESATTKQAKASSQALEGTEILTRNFSILREGAPAGDGWRALIHKDLAGTYALDSALARTAPAGEDGLPVTAIPGAGGICFVSPAVASCATVQEALTSGIAVVEFCAPDIANADTRLTALLPDGATPVTITGPGKEPTRMAAPENVLVHIQAGGPHTLSAPTLAAPVQLPQGGEGVTCG